MHRKLRSTSSSEASVRTAPFGRGVCRQICTASALSAATSAAVSAEDSTAKPSRSYWARNSSSTRSCIGTDARNGVIVDMYLPSIRGMHPRDPARVPRANDMSRTCRIQWIIEAITCISMTFVTTSVEVRSLVNIARYAPGEIFGPRVMTSHEFVWLREGSATWEILGSGGGVTETHRLIPGVMAL